VFMKRGKEINRETFTQEIMQFVLEEQTVKEQLTFHYGALESGFVGVDIWLRFVNGNFMVV
jgi:hypothetical protein